jgi:hypothetical protein
MQRTVSILRLVGALGLVMAMLTVFSPRASAQETGTATLIVTTVGGTPPNLDVLLGSEFTLTADDDPSLVLTFGDPDGDGDADLGDIPTFAPQRIFLLRQTVAQEGFDPIGGPIPLVLTNGAFIETTVFNPPSQVAPTEVPATEVPATEVPATEVPATEVPATEVPPTEVVVAPTAVVVEPTAEVVEPTAVVVEPTAAAEEPPAAEEPTADAEDGTGDGTEVEDGPATEAPAAAPSGATQLPNTGTGAAADGGLSWVLVALLGLVGAGAAASVLRRRLVV